MKGLKVFLSYYGLVVTTILVVVSAFFLPRPQGLITAVVLLPVNFLFWFNVTNPEKIDAGRWSMRLVVAVLILASLGIYGFFLSTKFSPTYKTATQSLLEEIDAKLTTLGEATNKDVDINSELEALKSELEALKENQQAALGVANEQSLANIIDTEGNQTPSLNEPVGSLTIKEVKNSPVSVYEKESLSSKIIGSLTWGQKYSFYKSQGDWYLVELPEGELGYVQARLVVETSR